MDGIKPKLSHMTSNRTKDHVVLKEQQAKHEKELQEHTEKMEEYKETVREAYTNLFTKWLECCHHISGVWLEEHLNKIVNCQLLVSLPFFVDFGTALCCVCLMFFPFHRFYIKIYLRC